MILELADIRIHAGQNAAFEEAINRAASTLIVSAKGAQGYKINRGIESPERYVLQIFWDTLEDHTVGFRQSAQYQQWRALLHHFYDPFPTVLHYTVCDPS